MDKEYSLGQMVGDMKGHIEMTRNMDREHILGQMVECMQENGKMIKGMDSANTLPVNTT